MVKSEKKMRDLVWLRLRGYHAVSLKPEFDGHTVALERAIREGVLVYPDLARPDFYDVVLEEGWAYIHVYRDEQVVYLVAYCPSPSKKKSAVLFPCSSHENREPIVT
jgi:hypothetical protein